jgi:hypothetical protein
MGKIQSSIYSQKAKQAAKTTVYTIWRQNKQQKAKQAAHNTRRNEEGLKMRRLKQTARGG